MRTLWSFLVVLMVMLSMGNSHAARVEVLHQADGVIWGFDFVSRNEVLMTLRSGEIIHFSLETKKAKRVHVPFPILSEGQGGLLDLRRHPKFTENHLVYITFAKNLGKGRAATALARFQWKNGEASAWEEILVTKSENSKEIHFGSRIAFDSDENLFMTVGDRNDRDQAQKPDSHMGKILKVKGKDKVEVYSLGHRNPQGLAIEPVSQKLYSSEFGPRGGDEINLIQEGKNYGWPVITYGKEYWGPSIGEGKSKVGMEQPIQYWVPSISPSAIHFFNSDRPHPWKGSLFVATLSGMHLRRLELQDGKVIREEELFKDKNWRFRSVNQGLDFELYVSTDSGVFAKVSR